MKPYIIIYDTDDDTWNLYEFNTETNKPQGWPVLTHDESEYELMEEAREWGIPREAVLFKARSDQLNK